MPNKLTELRKLLEDAQQERIGSAKRVKHLDFALAAQAEFPAMLDVIEAAEAVVECYWESGNELLAMQALRAALEKWRQG